MTAPELLALAERIEQAGAEEQAALLWLAWTWLPRKSSTAEDDRIIRMIDAEAYESAAMMLVENARVILNIAEDGITFALVRENAATAATAALAIAAAALRARAEG